MSMPPFGSFEVECPDCDGTGAAEKKKEHPECPDCTCIGDCARCDGSGTVTVKQC